MIDCILCYMEHNGEDKDIALINYRLVSIEQQISELKELLIDVPRLKDRLVITEKQSEENKNEIEELKYKVQELQNAPVKKDAARWQYILDFIFKLFVSAAVIYFFSQMGVKA